MKSRRLKYIDVSPELIAALVCRPRRFVDTDGTEVSVTVNGVPDDARGVRIGITDSGNLRLMVEHDSFPETWEGDMPSRAFVAVTKHYEPHSGGYQPRSGGPVDPSKLKPPRGGSAIR